MKVKIGTFPNRAVCNIHVHYMDRRYGYLWSENKNLFEKILEKVQDVIQVFYDCTINLFLDRREQKIDVRIDRWDTWSMDHTLSYIVLPMLQQLKATKHGASFVEMKDRPEHLRCKKLKYETDEHHFEAWDWALDEMIYAFNSKANKDDVIMRFDPKTEKEEMKAEQERISNGFRLFGKYYESLWD
mgnify:CR=1 FL=1